MFSGKMFLMVLTNNNTFCAKIHSNANIFYFKQVRWYDHMRVEDDVYSECIKITLIMLHVLSSQSNTV